MEQMIVEQPNGLLGPHVQQHVAKAWNIAKEITSTKQVNMSAQNI